LLFYSFALLLKNLKAPQERLYGHYVRAVEKGCYKYVFLSEWEDESSS
jgi:hypothetical protein